MSVPGRVRDLPSGQQRWSVVLEEALRVDFDVDAYHPCPDDPVLGRAACRVGGCAGFTKARGLCDPHHRAWTLMNKPDLDGFVVEARPLERKPRRAGHGFEFYRLGDVARREWCYVLQCRHDERGAPITPLVVSVLTELMRRSGERSLLKRPLEEWLAALETNEVHAVSHQRAFLRYAYARLEDLATAGDPDVIYGRDIWDARRLGIEPHRGPHRISFTAIKPAWLGDAAKAWARFRLATGTRFSSVAGDVAAIRVFSGFLAARAAPPLSEASIDRALIEDYLLALVGSGRSAATRTGLLVGLKLFLDHGRRHQLLPRLSASAVVYREDLPRREPAVPRFIDETAMAQLESDEALAVLPDKSTRRLVVTLIETGLRLGDACLLDFDCVMVDSAGWPCLVITTPRSPPNAWCRSPSGPRRPSPPNRSTSAPASRPARRCCSPESEPTQTGPARMCPPPCQRGCGPGAKRSTCATRPASRPPLPLTASVTPSAPG